MCLNTSSLSDQLQDGLVKGRPLRGLEPELRVVGEAGARAAAVQFPVQLRVVCLVVHRQAVVDALDDVVHDATIRRITDEHYLKAYMMTSVVGHIYTVQSNLLDTYS